MKNTVNNTLFNVKKVSFNRPNNFLLNLARIQDSKPIEAGEDEVIKCRSTYLSALAKLQDISFITPL
jgi:hypothetical protein